MKCKWCDTVTEQRSFMEGHTCDFCQKCGQTYNHVWTEQYHYCILCGCRLEGTRCEKCNRSIYKPLNETATDNPA